jgi:ribonucleotide reductase beta subunit family protein with ferritin-like domain
MSDPTEYVCNSIHEYVPDTVPEPLEDPKNLAYTIPPIQNPEVFSMYKKLLANTWFAEEVMYHQDLATWSTMDRNEKYFVKNILAFFASSDSLVMDNISSRLDCLCSREVRMFYAAQKFNESIHSETYGLLLANLVPELEERNMLFNAMTTISSIQKKCEWVQRWTKSGAPLKYIIIAFLAIEGVFFSGSFAAIYWLKKNGKLPALGFSNELISRDEGLHTDFGCLLYSMLKNPLDRRIIKRIFAEAVDIEKEFMTESIPCEMIGMNAKSMCEYIEYIADRLLVQLGCDKLYGSENPFDFVVLMGCASKVDFFARPPSDYKVSSVIVPSKEQVYEPDTVKLIESMNKVRFDADF